MKVYRSLGLEHKRDEVSCRQSARPSAFCRVSVACQSTAGKAADFTVAVKPLLQLLLGSSCNKVSVPNKVIV